MKKNSKLIVFAVIAASTIFGAGTAPAAESSARNHARKSRAPVPAYVPAPVYNWTGFYLGAHAGLGFGDARDPDIAAVVGNNSLSSKNIDGFVGGGHAGYNYQAGALVLGVEGDVEFANVNGSASDPTFPTGPVTAQFLSRWQASLRGRVGFAVDRTLFYGTGGAAFSGAKVTILGLDVTSDQKTLTGWTAGAGVEYALDPNWSLRAEYRYTDFGLQTFVVTSTPLSTSVGFRENQVVAGLSYKFGAPDSGLASPIITKAATASGQSSGWAMMPASAVPYGDVTVSATGLAVTNGFADRAAAEVAANWYDSNLGLHLDTSRNWREEDADFVAVGMSYAVTPYIRPKFMYGTSSENLGIEPETYLRGEIEFKTPPDAGATGIVATPSVTSSQFRNGVQELTPGIDLAFYHPALPDHTYFVSEVTATTTIVQSVSPLGYEFSGGETYVVPHWGTLGASLFGGLMVYDSTLCVTLCTVENRFVGVRPLMSFYLNHNDNLELFFRGEFAATDFYNIYGGTVGLKTAF